MICPKCGAVSEKETDLLCPSCGALLTAPPPLPLFGAQSIRQGKKAREEIQKQKEKAAEKEQTRRRRAGASHATIVMPKVHDTRMDADNGNDNEDAVQTGEPEGYSRNYRAMYAEESMSDEAAAAYTQAHEKSRVGKLRMVNWMKVGLISACFLMAMLVGVYVFLKRTDSGQRVMARLGQEANSAALWTVGEEKLDQGDIPGAIESFEKAQLLDEIEESVDVDGLLLLGNAYEADGRIKDAADLYEKIYQETPSRTEAYTNHIRILLSGNNPGDLARAADLMKLAYEKTGDSAFNTQRNDLIPAAPEVDLTAGYYETKKYIAITSYQGYDVYYTFDEEAELPAGGTLFTERVFLDEGIHVLRAVAVNGELVSDVLTGTYKIIMPSPQTPRANLAPKTYKNRQKVKLRPGEENENDDDIVLYYTVDGSEPDADSPVYDGTPILLPSGRVYLKAVAVNRYGKVSNTLEIFYKIEAKPYPLSAYTVDDVCNNIILYVTTMPEFLERYGEGNGYKNFYSEILEADCRKYEYDWGYAVMAMRGKTWVLAELYTTSTMFNGPRGTGIGDPESYVVGKFRDMGQVESASGNRGLYDTDDGTGKIWMRDDGGKTIRYIAWTADSHRWQFDYITGKNGTVTAMDMIYIP